MDKIKPTQKCLDHGEGNLCARCDPRPDAAKFEKALLEHGYRQRYQFQVGHLYLSTPDLIDLLCGSSSQQSRPLI